jgi:ankyrin repeat protein
VTALVYLFIYLFIFAGMRGTALCAAIETRNFEITKFLLDSGCDVNAQDFDGEPPLLLALRKQSPGQICGKTACLDIVKLLLNHPKCNLNKVDPLTKKSALHFATEQDMAQVVEWLISSKSKIECNINHMDANGNAPLHLAVLEGLTDVVEVLISRPKCLIKIYNKAGLTPLHICARNGDVANMEKILRRVSKASEKCVSQKEQTVSELDLNLNSITLIEKETSLHIACKLGHEGVVELLLRYGAKVDFKDFLGNTPLLVTLASSPHWKTKDSGIPKMLLNKGADPNVISVDHRCRYIEPSQVVSPLSMAVKNANLELTKILICSGADVNFTDNMGQCPLFIALWGGALSVASFLLQECSSININTQTDDGNTCLHAIVKCRKNSNSKDIHKIVRTIMNAGGKIYANKANKTVLDKAFEFEDHILFDAVLEELDCNIGDIEVIEVFQNTEETDVFICGNVPDDIPKVQRWIHKASSEGLIEMMRVLLSHGADIDASYFDYDTHQSLSNLYIALYNTEYKMAEFLVKNGANLKTEKYIYDELENDNGNGDKRNDIIVNERDIDDDDDDDEDDECSSSDDDVFHGNEEFRKWLLKVACTPQTLKLSCLVMIRKIFINNKIPFTRMDRLKLPNKLTSELCYKV